MQFILLILVIFALYEIWQKMRNEPRVRKAKDQGTVIDLEKEQTDLTKGPLPYQKYPYLQRERAERLLFDGLKEKLDSYPIEIYPDISLTRLIFVPKTSEHYGAYYNRINGKTVDIVLCHAGTREVLAAVFLDYFQNDSASSVEEASFTDRALEKAGIPSLHFMASADGYDWDYVLKMLMPWLNR